MQTVRMTVTCRSRITAEDGETTELSSVCPGCLRDGVLTYTETSEGAKIYHRIILPDGRALTVERSGAIMSSIRFEEKTVHQSLYRIPPYTFDMSVETQSLSVLWRGSTLHIHLVFSSLLGGSRQRTEMEIFARPREEGTP